MTNEKMERVDYIVLDKTQATYASNWASWDIGDYMFKQYEDDDEVFISLHSAGFGAIVTNPTTVFSEVLIDNVEVKNQENSNRENILALQESNVFLRSSVYYLSAKNKFDGDMKLNVQKFYKIKLAIRYQSALVDFISTTRYSFILKVEYKKRN